MQAFPLARRVGQMLGTCVAGIQGARIGAWDLEPVVDSFGKAAAAITPYLSGSFPGGTFNALVQSNGAVALQIAANVPPQLIEFSIYIPPSGFADARWDHLGDDLALLKENKAMRALLHCLNAGSDGALKLSLFRDKPPEWRLKIPPAIFDELIIILEEG